MEISWDYDGLGFSTQVTLDDGRSGTVSIEYGYRWVNDDDSYQVWDGMLFDSLGKAEAFLKSTGYIDVDSHIRPYFNNFVGNVIDRRKKTLTFIYGAYVYESCTTSERRLIGRCDTVEAAMSVGEAFIMRILCEN